MFQSNEITRINQVLGEKFRHKDGPFFQSLDHALAKLHVERQAYHGGTFVGNHVHKLVKVKFLLTCSVHFLLLQYRHTYMCISQKSSAQVLCSGIVAIAREKCPSLLQEAEQLYSRFTTALTLFEKCHLVYNGGVTDDSTIDQLGK